MKLSTRWKVPTMGEVTHGMTAKQCERVALLRERTAFSSFMFGVLATSMFAIICAAFGIPFLHHIEVLPW